MEKEESYYLRPAYVLGYHHPPVAHECVQCLDKFDDSDIIQIMEIDGKYKAWMKQVSVSLPAFGGLLLALQDNTDFCYSFLTSTS
jgi:hypothetical protein